MFLVHTHFNIGHIICFPKALSTILTPGVIIPCICVLGIIGNIVTLKSFFWSGVLRSASTLPAALAIADIMVLFTNLCNGIMFALVHYHILDEVFIESFGSIVFMLFQSVFLNATGLILFLIGCERVYAIKKPLHVKLFFTKKVKIVLSVLAFTISSITCLAFTNNNYFYIRNSSLVNISENTNSSVNATTINSILTNDVSELRSYINSLNDDDNLFNNKGVYTMYSCLVATTVEDQPVWRQVLEVILIIYLGVIPVCVGVINVITLCALRKANSLAKGRYLRKNKLRAAKIENKRTVTLLIMCFQYMLLRLPCHIFYVSFYSSSFWPKKYTFTNHVILWTIHVCIVLASSSNFLVYLVRNPSFFPIIKPFHKLAVVRDRSKTISLRRRSAYRSRTNLTDITNVKQAFSKNNIYHQLMISHNIK